MAECPCDDYQGERRFPGPDGIVYVIETHLGCTYCRKPAGVVIHRFAADARELFRADELPELDISGGAAFVPVLDPAALHRALVPMLTTDAVRESLDEGAEVLEECQVTDAVETAICETLRESDHG